MVFPNHYAEAADPLPQSDGARRTEWFEGDRFVWNGFFTHETYTGLRERLPRDQTRVTQELTRFDLIPIDVAEGKDRPRISYVRGSNGKTAVYARLPGLISLDLSGYMGDVPLDLSPLERSAIEIITFPEKSGSNGQLAALLLADGALPNLRHIDVYPRPGAITADLVDVLAKRGGLRSLQLSGPHADDGWLARLPKLDGLTGLRLHGASVTAKGLKLLSQIRGLTSLAIVQCDKIDGAAIDVLRDCPGLRELQFCDWKLPAPTLKAISRLDQVERVAIDTPDITMPALNDLFAMKGLNTLVVRSKDADVRSALEDWRKQRKGRRVFLDADWSFGGWIGDPGIFWKHPRRIEPEHFP